MPATCFWQRGSIAALAPSFDVERIAERSKTGSPAGAWAKPDVHLVCGECDERMEAD
jgi:hypothetical protein